MTPLQQIEQAIEDCPRKDMFMLGRVSGMNSAHYLTGYLTQEQFLAFNERILKKGRE